MEPLDEYDEDHTQPLPLHEKPTRRRRSPRKHGKDKEMGSSSGGDTSDEEPLERVVKRMRVSVLDVGGDTSDDEPLERVVKKIHVSIPDVEVEGSYRTLRRRGREGSGRYLSVNIRLS